jgi:hypothetical protein
MLDAAVVDGQWSYIALRMLIHVVLYLYFFLAIPLMITIAIHMFRSYIEPIIDSLEKRSNPMAIYQISLVYTRVAQAPMWINIAHRSGGTPLFLSSATA